MSDSTPKFDRFCVRCRSQSEGREPVSKALAQVLGTTKEFSYTREILPGRHTLTSREPSRFLKFRFLTLRRILLGSFAILLLSDKKRFDVAVNLAQYPENREKQNSDHEQQELDGHFSFSSRRMLRHSTPRGRDMSLATATAATARPRIG